MADEKIPKHIKQYVDAQDSKLTKEFKGALAALEKRLKTVIVTLDTRLKRAISD